MVKISQTKLSSLEDPSMACLKGRVEPVPIRGIRDALKSSIQSSFSLGWLSSHSPQILRFLTRTAETLILIH